LNIVEQSLLFGEEDGDGESGMETISEDEGEPLN
jgi:hypothetical protein